MLNIDLIARAEEQIHTCFLPFIYAGSAHFHLLQGYHLDSRVHM